MFERPHHQRIASVLDALDTRLLESHACLFGGGTAIALKHGEYRESVDVDFLVSDLAGYRELRARLNAEGINAVARKPLVQAREVRADQYGIRTMLAVHDVEVKFEIVLEARVALESSEDRICGVSTLTTLDMATTKLLASSDRWADDSVHSRDLIDLAMMKLDKATLHRAIEKASGAYGASIERDLAKAVDALRSRKGRLAACMSALQMTTTPPGIAPVPIAVVWSEIKRLAPRKHKASARRK